MSRVTYFVALPFEYDGEGELVAGKAREAQTEGAARRMASAMAAGKPGAIAFARTGDPSTGEFEDAVILARYGEVADDAVCP
jgi:hypothetical protein